jgi:hypothetical protein
MRPEWTLQVASTCVDSYLGHPHRYSSSRIVVSIKRGAHPQIVHVEADFKSRSDCGEKEWWLLSSSALWTWRRLEAHRMALGDGEARIECGAEVWTHGKLAMSAGEGVLDQRFRLLRMSDRGLEFQNLGLHQSGP